MYGNGELYGQRSNLMNKVSVRRSYWYKYLQKSDREIVGEQICDHVSVIPYRVSLAVFPTSKF